nr:MAG: hypothetical protein J07AB56_12760 [Candidatus Nanosalinarum sp. J07AB56]
MKAVLVTYEAKRKNFESMHRRNQFYRGLFGYKQTVKRNGKRYEYDKDGLVDVAGVTRVDDSVIVARRGCEEPVLDYMQDWQQVSHHVFKVEIQDKDVREKLQNE